jgi:signal transduction histidine kinase
MTRSQPNSSQAASQWFQRLDPRVTDVGLWLILGGPLLTRPVVFDRPKFAIDIAAAIISLACLLLRRRWQIPTLVVSLVAAVTATVIVQRPTVLLPVIIVLLYTVARARDRRTALQAGFVVLAAGLVCIAVLVSNNFLGPEILAGLAWPTLAVVAGIAVRTHREAMAAAEERAAWAEATREDEAIRRVIEERLHIARELHDVIAHKIAVVNVQAGVAAHLLRSRPDDAASALTTVRSSAREVLDELAGLLGVLRDVDDVGVSTEPTPALDDIPALVDSYVPMGLRVKLQTVGAPKRVSNASAITAYRTIQEALTNAHKYGDGQANLRMSWQHDALRLTITNQQNVTTTPTRSDGFGLLGMRERVKSVGGLVTALAKPDGTFEVDVSLPIAQTQGNHSGQETP